ncbi:MAG: 3-oxoacyl-[acyl-carrier-protein] synthase III C-terminal domain-containing protein [Chitinophagales bacterium]
MGKYLPIRQVSANELEERHQIPKGWIAKHSGVEYRHYANDSETCAYMGAKALEEALKKAGLVFEDLDLIVSASGSFDYPIPHRACWIPKEMGKLEAGIPCFDIDATCLSFITALDVVSSLLDGWRYRRVAIVSSEISSKSLNYKDWESSTLLGDGAAAAIVALPNEGENCAVLNANMQTFSKGVAHTIVRAGGNIAHGRDKSIRDEEFTFDMRGRELLRLVMQITPPFMKKLFEPFDFEVKDLDLCIPHQASKAGLKMGRRLLKLKEKQYFSHIKTHGNCIAASIPMALYDAIEAKQIVRGSKVLLVGTGAGLSIGGVVIRY